MAEFHRRGKEAELLAQEFLIRKGYRLVARNYRCKAGEIDLIFFEGRKLVFVEVRSSREARAWVGDSVGFRKQRKLRRAAENWFACESKKYPGLTDCRFDLVLVFGEAVEHRQDVIG